MLHDEGTTVVKFFLHISKDEQKKRLQERLDDPAKHWKWEASDLKMRGYWEPFQEAYEEVLEKTSTEYAPWYIVPANRKWYRDLAIARILVETLEKMAPHYPKKDIDPNIRLTD
jgi:polyphosphate kinase 2 (PPK2 family)